MQGHPTSSGSGGAARRAAARAVRDPGWQLAYVLRALADVAGETQTPRAGRTSPRALTRESERLPKNVVAGAYGRMHDGARHAAAAAAAAAFGFAFASQRDLTVVPAVPERDLGPEAHLFPSVVDLAGFLDLAGTLGGGVLYLGTAAFDPDEVEEPPTELLARRAQLGEVTVAVNSLIHFWRERAPWYHQWEDLAAAPRVPTGPGTGRGSSERGGTCPGSPAS